MRDILFHFELLSYPIAELKLEVVGNIHDDPELMEEASHAAD